MRLVTNYLIYESIFFLSSLCLTLCGSKLSGQTYQNYDAFLTNGSSASINYAPGGNVHGVVQVWTKSKPSTVSWVLGPDPWGLTNANASGQIGMIYDGNGTAQWSVGLTNLNTTQVIAFPFMGFGNDVWGYQNGNQGLTFPVLVSNQATINGDRGDAAKKIVAEVQKLSA